MPAMFASLFLRCFLLLALLLNGLVAAHATVQLPMQVPAQEMAADMAHEGCHDMGDMSAEDEQPQTKALHADCCKGGVCQCVCATQASAAGAELQLSPVPPVLLQAALPTVYRSVDLALILRPPIA